MAALWTLEDCCYISRTAAGLHEDLVFIVWKGQLSKDIPVQEEELAVMIVTGVGNTERTAPPAGRTKQHFAACVHQLMKNFVKAMGQTGPVFR